MTTCSHMVWSQVISCYGKMVGGSTLITLKLSKVYLFTILWLHSTIIMVYQRNKQFCYVISRLEYKIWFEEPHITLEAKCFILVHFMSKMYRYDHDEEELSYFISNSKFLQHQLINLLKHWKWKFPVSTQWLVGQGKDQMVGQVLKTDVWFAKTVEWIISRQSKKGK